MQQLVGFTLDSRALKVRMVDRLLVLCLVIVCVVCGEYLGSSQPHPCWVEKGIEEMVVSLTSLYCTVVTVYCHITYIRKGKYCPAPTPAAPSRSGDPT